MNKSIIYGLYCPFTHNLHYVGQSSIGMLRPMDHMTHSHSEKINEWVDQLRFLGHKPEIRVLEECNEDELDEREVVWITKSINEGCYLLNKAHNGAGNIFLNSEYIKEMAWTVRIGQIIRRTRVDRDISMEELSNAACISRPTLHSIEIGKSTQVRIGSIKAVLDALGLNLDITKRKDNEEKISLNAKNEPRVRATRRKNEIGETAA